MFCVAHSSSQGRPRYKNPKDGLKVYPEILQKLCLNTIFVLKILEIFSKIFFEIIT